MNDHRRDHSHLPFKLLTSVGENMNSESFQFSRKFYISAYRDDVQKNLKTLPQETIPISAITSVNHVYAHKRSSQPELCHETLHTKPKHWKKTKYNI